MTTNEYKIKLTGIANTERPLKNGFCYDLEIKEVEVRKIERVPNDDGSEDEIASLRISELSEITIKSGEKEMRAVKKGSQSRVLRAVLEQKADDLGIDREKYYQQRMTEIIEKERVC